MKSWDELSRKEQLVASHYDFYKDVHGVRPRWMNYDEMSEEDLELALEQLSRESEIQRAAEEEIEREKIQNFEVTINDLLRAGAKSREMAISWLHEANETNGDDEYLCYCLGLPYGYFRKVA